jgi:hypothetical protein
MTSQSSNTGSWAKRTRLGTNQSQLAPSPGGVGNDPPAIQRPPTVARTGAALSTPPYCTALPTESPSEELYQAPPGNNFTPLRDAIAQPPPPRAMTGQYDDLFETVDDDSSDGIAATANDANDGLSPPLLSNNNVAPPAMKTGADGDTPCGGVASTGTADTHIPPGNIPTSVDLPDTPALQRRMGMFIDKICDDIGNPPLDSRDAITNAVAILRSEMASTQAQMELTQKQMRASQRNLEGVLAIVSNLVMKEELHSSITTIIR